MLGQSTENSEGLADQILFFRDELLRVNRSINLISRRSSETVANDLIYEALTLIPIISYPPLCKVVDIGSGAGIPGLVHKIIRRDLQLISVDSNRRKIEFQRHVSSRLKLTGCEFVADRIERIPALQAEVCIARSLTDFLNLIPLSAAHLRAAGTLCIITDLRSQISAEESRRFDLQFQSRVEYNSSLSGRRSAIFQLKKS